MEISAIECRSLTFVLNGKKLWHNATVTIGGQISDRLRVLPNLDAVQVQFDKVAELAPPEASEERRDIKIFTSEGVADAGKVVVKRGVEAERQNCNHRAQ